MKIGLAPRTRLYVLSGCVGLACVGAFAAAGTLSGWTDEAAAWVQAAAAAIGMAVAIGVAGWQGVEARALVRDQANADLRRRLDALVGLLQAANHEVWRWRRFLLRRSIGTRRDVETVPSIRMPFADDAERLEIALANIELHELPSWDLADAVLLMRQALRDTVAVGTQIFHLLEMGHPNPNPLVPQVELARKALLKARSAQERLLDERLSTLVTEHPQDPERTVEVHDVSAASLEMSFPPRRDGSSHI